MKTFLFRHGARVRGAVAILTAALFGISFHAAGADPMSSVVIPVAIYALLASVPSREGVLGISYPISNAKTKASALADTAKAEEELWIKRIFLGTGRYYAQNPFEDNMLGGADSKKAIVEILDTQKVAGTAVNIPLISGLDGEPVYGENVRAGNEIQYQVGNFQVKVDYAWLQTAFTQRAKDQTAIGSQFETRASDDLTRVFAKTHADNILMTARLASRTAKGAQNLVLPDNRANVDQITTADVFNTTLLGKGANVLPGFGAMPMNAAKDASGSERPVFMTLATNYAVDAMENDPLYVNAKNNADVRGADNANFKGNLLPWKGQLVYRWWLLDHANKGPLGNPLVARERLGVAMPAASLVSGATVQLGGLRYNATDTPTRLYAKFFPGSPYTFWNGDTNAMYPSVNSPTTAFIAIIGPDGTFGVYPYNPAPGVGNNGSSITLNGGIVAVGPAGQRASGGYTFPVNSLVLQCNALGTYIGRTLMFGAEFMATGVGSINGKKADDPGVKMGDFRRDEEDSGRVIKYGAGTTWGCRLVERVDGTYPNFVMLEHAINVPGAPLLN